MVIAVHFGVGHKLLIVVIKVVFLESGADFRTLLALVEHILGDVIYPIALVFRSKRPIIVERDDCL